jgi:hypothetical protein
MAMSSFGTSRSQSTGGKVGESSGKAGSNWSGSSVEGGQDGRLVTRVDRRSVLACPLPDGVGKFCLTNAESNGRGVLSYQESAYERLNTILIDRYCNLVPVHP